MEMKRLIATAMVMLLALPAMAAEEGCIDYTFGRSGDNNSPIITSTYIGDYPGFRTAVVGSFFWVEFGTAEETGDSYDFENISSIDISDPLIIGATVCASDQSVALYTAPPEPDSEDEAPVEELAPAVQITIDEPFSYEEPLVYWTNGFRVIG